MRLRALGFGLLLAGAVLAACSGNIGGGSAAVPGAPGAPGALASGVSPTGTPSSASGIVNVAATAGPQTLPNVGGYTASVAFPQTSASPTTMNVVTSLNVPPSVPDPFTTKGGKKGGLFGLGGKKKEAASPYKALLYITFVPTKTIEFDHLPQFVFGVPETVIASLGQKWDLGLGYLDPADKSHKFKLAVAERIAVATAAPTASPSATPTQTPTATPSPSPKPSGSASASPSSTPTPTPAPTPTITLVAIGFSAPEMDVKMEANKTYVFVLYAITSAPPSAAPTGSGSPAATGNPSPAASASASAASSGSPAAASPAPAPSASARATASSI